MKTAAAWNVKGVGIDARETAREAARRAGLSVGEWLNSVIVDSADGGQDGHLTDQEAENFSAIRQQLDALTARVGTMAAPPRASAPGPCATAPPTCAPWRTGSPISPASSRGAATKPRSAWPTPSASSTTVSIT